MISPGGFKRHSIFGHNVVLSYPCRKSLKSLFFLLPLLGVTNILHHLWPNPLRGSWPSFAIWSFTTHFLYSFQGVFVASVYFLFDKKVVVETKLFRICYNNFVNHHINRNTTSEHFSCFQVIEVLKKFWKRATNRGDERFEPSKFYISCHNKLWKYH